MTDVLAGLLLGVTLWSALNVWRAPNKRTTRTAPASNQWEYFDTVTHEDGTNEAWYRGTNNSWYSQPEVPAVGASAVHSELIPADNDVSPGRTGGTAMNTTPTTTTTHRCPAEGCDQLIPDNMLACRSDWFRVTEATQRRVAESYGNPDSNVIRLAIAKAVAEMNMSRRKAHR